MKPNKTCVICHSEYSYCNRCSADLNKPTWYALFDSDNCHDIYNLCVGYRDNNLTLDEAYEKLEKCDLSKIDNFEVGTQEMINKILGEKKVQDNKNFEEKENETMVEINEDLNVINPVEEKETIVTSISKKTFSKKKR